MRKAIQICVALFFSCSLSWGQTKISITQSKNLVIEKAGNSRQHRLSGNVILRQDVAIMSCDSALLIQPENSFDAFGNVRIVQDDTLTITGDQLHYEGELRTFEIWGNVVLTTPSSRLETKRLTYDRNSAIARYSTRSTLHRKTSSITADYGSYNTRIEKTILVGHVESVDTNSRLSTDTLVYYPNQNVYQFAGPSTLIRDSSTITCAFGYYDADKGTLQLSRGAKIEEPTRTIAADSLSFDLKVDRGTLLGSALVADSIQGFVLSSAYIYYEQEPSFVNAWSPIHYRYKLGEDTLYSKADSLFIREDALGFNTVRMNGNVKVYHNKIQALSPQFTYEDQHEIIRLFPDPILWSEKNQFRSDSSALTLNQNNLDQLFLERNVRILSLGKDSIHNNMAKSKRLDGQFMDNQIQEIRLTGNAESVMHIFNDESALQGTNQSTSSWISLHFVLGELTNVKVGKNIDATYVPASSGEVPKLEGCVNEFNLRPSKASTLLILK